MKKALKKGIILLISILTLTSCVNEEDPNLEDDKTQEEDKNDEKEEDKEEVEINKFTYIKGTNDVSETYKTSKYYDRLTSFPKTGDGRVDLLTVALSQLGYQEGNTEDFSGVISGKDNYTEYNYNMGSFGQGYGGKNYEWCASFVSFCLLQSGCTTLDSIEDWCRSHYNDPEYIWREVGCRTWVQQLKYCGYFEDSLSRNGNYQPRSGDIVFFQDAKATSATHVGIVLYSDDNTLYTIEGNTSDPAKLDSNGGGVYSRTYSLDSTYVIGYGVLPYVDKEGIEIDYFSLNRKKGMYINTLPLKVYSYLNYEKIELPRFSIIEVEEIFEDGKDFVYEIKTETGTKWIIEEDLTKLIPITQTK